MSPGRRRGRPPGALQRCEPGRDGLDARSTAYADRLLPRARHRRARRGTAGAVPSGARSWTRRTSDSHGPSSPLSGAPAGGTAAAARPTVSTVTVIVPACNEEAGIASTIEGLLTQDAPDWLQITDVVVVVNNSTDRTAEIARRYPVTVLEMAHNPHKKSGAMNHGWREHGAQQRLRPDDGRRHGAAAGHRREDGQGAPRQPGAGRGVRPVLGQGGARAGPAPAAPGVRAVRRPARAARVEGERGQRRSLDVPAALPARSSTARGASPSRGTTSR